MTTTQDAPIFLTVRGTHSAATVDAARVLHNETAGSERGIAAARALGDLSHNVYVPAAGAQSGAKSGELLFLDVWENPAGLMEFFSNEHVQAQGAKMFTSKDASVWMPARGSFSFKFQAPSSRHDRYVGMIRAKITSPETAIEAFRTTISHTVRDARKRGQMSHEIFIRMNPPGDDSPVELLGIDVWYDAKGMAEHYAGSHMSGLAPAFAGAPDASIWEQAPGNWSEW